ncbi:hypothetical protein IID21_02675 [Patescibacteria group bacterium]|nr:hypothetical protein [Patescibacteria group bacterium]
MEKPEYPTTLDVVKFKGKEVQVVASAQTGDLENDIYTVRDTKTGETFRVTGAKFVPSGTQDPSPGQIHRGDEGVKITGSLTGGEKED